MRKTYFSVITAILLCMLLPLSAFAAGLGDVDGNGKITSADARIALRIAARVVTPDYDMALRADINEDQKISASDARTILRIAAKLQEAPTEGPEVTLPPPPTTEAPATQAPVTQAPITEIPTTEAPKTEAPSTEAPTTENPTTEAPTTEAPTTEAPTTEAPTTEEPTTAEPTTAEPTTAEPTTAEPTTEETTDPVAPLPTEPGALTPKQIYNIAKGYTVEIIVEGHDDYYGDYKAMGSGFYISADGKLITNYHVIDGAKKITVKHYDDTEYEVNVIEAYDKNSDLALLRVEGVKDITPAVLSKQKPETGDVIYTLGSSLGLTGTFTQGIISNAARVDSGFNPTMTYIQFDAAVTNGNSGGPLINDRGEVIGVNDWGYTEGQNLNFAIPVSYIDELYVNPVTLEDFAGGKDMNASSNPDAPRFTGVVRTDGSEANVRPHTPASMLFLVSNTSDLEAICASELVIEGAPENVTVAPSGWFYTEDSYGNTIPACVIMMWADEPVDAVKITMHVAEAPEMRAEFTLTVSEGGSADYFGFSGTPDFGAFAEKSPSDFTMTTTVVYFGEEYTVSTPPTFTYDNVSASLLNDYLTVLEDAGFTLYSSGLVSLGSTQYVYNDPNDEYQMAVTATRVPFRGYTVEIQLTHVYNTDNLEL